MNSASLHSYTDSDQPIGLWSRGKVFQKITTQWGTAFENLVENFLKTGCQPEFTKAQTLPRTEQDINFAVRLVE